MEIALIILIVLIAIISAMFFYLFKKERGKNKQLEKINTDNISTIRNFNKKISSLETPIRKGYYTKNYTQGKHKYVGVIFVQEMDRYVNGESKITLLNVELRNISNSSVDEYSATRFIEKNFCSIRRTDEITWLESKDSIKKIRKSKMDEIKRKFGGEP